MSDILIDHFHQIIENDLFIYRSSPDTSTFSPGKSPSDKTQESSSWSSAGSGVFRIRPVGVKIT